MAAGPAGDELARSMSRHSSLSASFRNWASASIKEAFPGVPGGDAFEKTSVQEDEEELRLAAIERLPTYERSRKDILNQVHDDGRIRRNEISNVDHLDTKQTIASVLEVVKDDHEGFLRRIRERIDRVGIKTPKIEVRYNNLSVEGDVFIGSRALPTLLNSILNTIEGFLQLIRLVPSNKKILKILQDLSGILKPSRMTLLLGPPGSGRTTFMRTLAGVVQKDLRVTGEVTYCGHKMSEFIPQRTSAYISQHDVHQGEMTVWETLDFAAHCLGVGTRYDLLVELLRRERIAGITPDPDIDAFMKATTMTGQESSLVTDYILKILGLDICANIMVGDEMRRGISGGQKKRVTTGEMLVGPAKVFFMDEISTGLDSSTTYQIVKYLKEMVHITDATMMIALLQPAPETFELFDDIILLSEGQMVYQGPRTNVLDFFEEVGFKCPKRKGVADFLQEVTSRKDQEQYWFRKEEPYRFISVPEFTQLFARSQLGQNLYNNLTSPYDVTKVHPAALVDQKYGISNLDLLRANLAREWLLMKRNAFLYIFKTCQITIMSIIAFSVFFRTTMKSGQLKDGGKYMGALFFSLINMMFNGAAELALTVMRLPVFYKQRDSLFYPAWAFAVPIWLLKIPISVVESVIWIAITYYTIGFAPAAYRFYKQLLAYISVHQMALCLFRFLASIGRIQVVASALGTFTLLIVFVLGGFIVAKDDIEPWMIWGYYISPMMYGQNAIMINEFLDDRWNTPNPDPRINEPTVGKVLLSSRGMFTTDYMFWVCVGALIAYSVIFTIFFVLALTYLNPRGGSRTVVPNEDEQLKHSGSAKDDQGTEEMAAKKKGMVLPFQPLSLAFDHVNYYVDMPAEMKAQGITEDRLQLLRDVSGAFRPGVLTALVGVSGAGKTTLMDVLAGRKTGGYIEGDISISGYPKKQETFARVSGYCEQNDIHSPHVTVYESLVYSAWLRLAPDVSDEARQTFVEEVMNLVELNSVRDSLVELPGVSGLSTEQRKRLTIAVELVANPSIIFMDEPTSGLDARAAAIVMRTVRNTVDTGRTVVCTIHQPSIDIFEAFDELMLMKRGGQVIYAGPLGHHSRLLVEYFQKISGITRIKDGQNPATWMLEVSSSTVEAQLNVDFASIYAQSELYRRNQELIQDLSTPAPGVHDLHFPTKYSQSFFEQCNACLWKQLLSYWRHPQYNVVRFLMTTVIGVMFGIIFWDKGQKTSQQQDLMNMLGAMYAAVMFLGGTNTQSVQTVVSIERTVFYREKAAGMYSPLPYAFAQVAIEVIYVCIQTLIYSLLLYSMIGFAWSASKFLWFYFFVYMCFIYFTLYGMMLVALTPNYHIAAITMSFFLSFWNLFSGFIIPRTQIPIWWRWYYWGSPVAWTLYGLITSQVGQNEDLVEVPGAGSVPVREFIKDYMGFEYDFLGYVAMAHVGWVVLFFIVFVCGIKFLNFQKR
ncbi:putative ABC transporter, AAA+ ATPase domain, ABC-2 type transporter, ABC-transporter [Helianthus annuus]|nr:putative ABC transporter, AAA+ ATPase domain, ABC-2 type transporter, ABC-transporter [Helianthus annuus]